jgi:arylsulfatase
VSARVAQRLAALLALGGGLAGCAPPRPPQAAPNLVVVTLDTTRADHLGLYGYMRETSPALDAFASEALVFERAVTPMATTLPAHTSLFTAAHPLEHGVLANLGHGGRRFVPAPGLATAASALREAGYRTAAFVSALPLARGSGIEVGFELFDEPAEPATRRLAAPTTDAALRWLASAEAPFLLWVHYFDAHWPFPVAQGFAGSFETDAPLERWIAERAIPPTSVREGVGAEASRATLNAYDAALRSQDAELGRLVAALRERPDWDATAVLVVGDHGEGLSQHGHAAHGGTWDEQLRIPLLMRVHGQAPRRIDTLIAMEDVLPTLRGLLPALPLGSFPGAGSGRDVLAGAGSPGARLSLDSGRLGSRPGYRVALTTPRWKYFRSDGAGGREQLYDLVDDPFELRDAAAQHPEVLAGLRADLEGQLSARIARGQALRGAAASEAGPPQPELVERLRALGYVEPAPGQAP